MDTVLTTGIVFGCLIGVVIVGLVLGRFLPQHHLSPDSRDVVKLAMGLVATMAALVLGLLVRSAKSDYDTKRSEVIQMAAKIAFLDRALAAYGPEADAARMQFRHTVDEAVQRMWPAAGNVSTNLAPDTEAGNVVYEAIQSLSPHDDAQRSLKAQASNLTIELGQTRALLVAQSGASVSIAMLLILVSWLVVIFLGFSVLAPHNATAVVALVVSAFAVSGAIFLILELDQPFRGLIGISSQPMLKTLHQLGK